MNKLFSKKLWTAVTVAVASLLVIAISLYTVAYSYQTLLNSELDLINYKLVTDGESEDGTEYFTAKHKTEKDIHDYAYGVSYELESEGLVLLENNGALPLNREEDIKVSLFGTGSVNVNCSVQGMRGATDKTDMPTLKEAFEAVDDKTGKVEVNPTLWDFYVSGAGSKYGGEKRLDASTNIQTYYINEAPWSAYDVSVRGSFAQYSDAAIVVFTRDDTEGADMNAYGSDGADGNYLALSPEELALLKELTSVSMRSYAVY